MFADDVYESSECRFPLHRVSRGHSSGDDRNFVPWNIKDQRRRKQIESGGIFFAPPHFSAVPLQFGGGHVTTHQ